jgi:hypothetical protein
MTDETPQPEKPIDAEVVPTSPEPAFVSNTADATTVPNKMPSKLSLLPPEIIEEMDSRLKSNESVKGVREDMIKKYPNVEGLKVGYLTWMKRARKLNGGSQKEIKEGVVVKKEMVAALPTAEDIQAAVSTVLNPSVDLKDKEAVLTALYAKEMQRLAILEAKQKTFIDPNIEMLMLGYVKEVRALLETVTKLQEVLQKDLTTQFRGEIDELIRVILSTVYAAYKSVHKDEDPLSQFDAFRVGLEGHLTKTLAAYKSQPKV